HNTTITTAARTTAQVRQSNLAQPPPGRGTTGLGPGNKNKRRQAIVTGPAKAATAWSTCLKPVQASLSHSVEPSTPSFAEVLRASSPWPITHKAFGNTTK